VSIIGFPLGNIGEGGLAVCKTGSIASEIDVDWNGLPRFLIDARTKGGMSGSPVIAVRHGSYVNSGGGLVLGGGSNMNFLGIYSGRMKDDLDLGIVWKSDKFFELIQYADSLV
jgi:hypothetical protein